MRNTEMYACPSCVDDERKIVGCKCGKCKEVFSKPVIGYKGWTLKTKVRTDGMAESWYEKEAPNVLSNTLPIVTGYNRINGEIIIQDGNV